MIRAMQGPLDITEHDIDPGNRRNIHALIATTDNNSFMTEARRLKLAYIVDGLAG